MFVFIISSYNITPLTTIMPYFIDATKELILQQGHHFHAAVLGKPEGLARPRSRIMRRAGTNNGNGPPNAGRIHVYCPSRSHQHQLRRVLRSGFGNPTRIVFPRDVGLDVDLQFFIARPASHFFGSGPNQVKSCWHCYLLLLLVLLSLQFVFLILYWAVGRFFLRWQ